MTESIERHGEWCLVANISAKQPFGENPLYYCQTVNLHERNLIQLLLENGADVKTISYEFIESVTHNLSQYSECVVRLVEQAIDELFPHSRTIV